MEAVATALATTTTAGAPSFEPHVHVLVFIIGILEQHFAVVPHGSLAVLRHTTQEEGMTTSVFSSFFSDGVLVREVHTPGEYFTRNILARLALLLELQQFVARVAKIKGCHGETRMLLALVD